MRCFRNSDSGPPPAPPCTAAPRPPHRQALRHTLCRHLLFAVALTPRVALSSPPQPASTPAIGEGSDPTSPQARAASAPLLPTGPPAAQRVAARIRMLLDTRRLPEALDEIDVALAQYPDASNLLLARCTVLADLGRYEHAESCLQAFSVRVPQPSPQQQRRVSELLLLLRGPPAAESGATAAAAPPLSLATVAATRGGAGQGPSPRRPLWRRWWLWTSLVIGTAALSAGLAVGLSPRPYTHVEWPP